MWGRHRAARMSSWGGARDGDIAQQEAQDSSDGCSLGAGVWMGLGAPRGWMQPPTWRAGADRLVIVNFHSVWGCSFLVCMT